MLFQRLQIVVELCQQFPDKSHDTLGYMVLGYEATDAEYGHWMIACQQHPLEPIYLWHHVHTTPQKLKQQSNFILRL
mgnify:FL=1